MITKRISFALAVAGFLLAAAAGLRYAESLDLISAETARRTVQVIVGLILAVYGNYLPKESTRAGATVCVALRSQSALRVGGWSMTLAGLAQAGLWAFAPLSLANVASMIAVASATLITIVYSGWIFWSRKRPAA